jgi:Ca2+-binding EF-hand superfamily protein
VDGVTMSKTNKSELEKLQVSTLVVLACAQRAPSLRRQEAFYNFDEEKTGYLSIDDLRFIVTTGERPNEKKRQGACDAGAEARRGTVQCREG